MRVDDDGLRGEGYPLIWKASLSLGSIVLDLMSVAIGIGIYKGAR